MKVTIGMVKYWLGAEDGTKVLQQIANSKADTHPWTPEMLHNDIVETWKVNIEIINKRRQQ